MQATPNSGFLFSGWSGDLTGATNPQSLTMSAPRSVTANFSTVCTYGLLSSSASLTFAASSGNTIGVTASPGNCSWGASSPNGFVTITDPAPPATKTGNGDRDL